MNKFLIHVSDFLSTRVLPDIFARDDKDGMFNSMKGNMKIAGSQQNPKEAW
jgi:hypothetical protein